MEKFPVPTVKNQREIMIPMNNARRELNEAVERTTELQRFKDGVRIDLGVDAKRRSIYIHRKDLSGAKCSEDLDKLVADEAPFEVFFVKNKEASHLPPRGAPRNTTGLDRKEDRGEYTRISSAVRHAISTCPGTHTVEIRDINQQLLVSIR